MLGLNSILCKVVDELLDVEPPKVKDIIPDQESEDRVSIHFGFKKTEFPLMYRFIVRNYGLMGVECFIIRIVLNHVENMLKQGFTGEMIRDSITHIVGDYMRECRINEELCRDYIIVFKDIEEKLYDNLYLIINTVKERISKRISPADILVNSSTELLRFLLKNELHVRGYRGKYGYTVDRRVFMKAYSVAKRFLRQKIHQALVNEEIETDKILSSINKVRQQLKELEIRTVDKYLALLKEEMYQNKEFETFLRILKEVIEHSIKEL